MSELYNYDGVEVESLGIEVPSWINKDITCYDVAAILEGGCGSGAYMPAVTYHTANKTMSEYGGEVLDYLQERSTIEEITLNIQEDSWSGFACKVLSIAVEEWCYSNEDSILEAAQESEESEEEE